MLFLKNRNTAKITIAKVMIQLTISSRPQCRIWLSKNAMGSNVDSTMEKKKEDQKERMGGDKRQKK